MTTETTPFTIAEIAKSWFMLMPKRKDVMPYRLFWSA
jgi:hypothetical protein